MPTIQSLQALRALYPPVGTRSAKKQLPALDVHCTRFIALSPWVVLASTDETLALDASPRGGAPGFVKVVDERTLLIPDAPGNNRLDTLENIVQTGHLGLLFVVPGVDETLRVNGTALLSTDEADLALAADSTRKPKLVIRMTVQAAYLHCAKALMRAALWDATRHVDRAVLPSLGEMLHDQIGGDTPRETQAEMLVRYAQTL